MDKISVIMPVYNTGEAAVRMLLSILKCGYKNLEIIVVDDGSSDESSAFIKEFIRQYNIKFGGPGFPMIKFFQKENGGPSSARNFGISKATGKYLIFSDSDDTVEKDFIQKLHDTIAKNDNNEVTKVGLAGTAINYIRNAHDTKCKGRVLYNNHVKLLEKEESFVGFVLRLIYTDGRLYAVNNKIFRKSIIDQYNIRFDESINFAEDTKFVIDYLKAANHSGFSEIEFIPEPLYNYNFNTPTSIAANSSLSWGNWKHSFNYLIDWAGKDLTKSEMKALRLVYVRWKISHSLAVARSNQSFGHKMQHTNIFFLLPAEVIIKFR